MTPPPPSRRVKRPLKPRPVTEERLYNAALFYLQRYNATRAHLTDILKRKVKRWTLEEPDFAIGADEKIAVAVKRIVDLGYINDAVFAESKARSLRRQGKSETLIRQHLRHKGVRDEHVMEDAIEQADTNFVREQVGSTFDAEADDETIRAEAEKQALQRFIKRKRRFQSDDPEQRQKDLAKILRAGFSWDLVRGLN